MKLKNELLFNVQFNLSFIKLIKQPLPALTALQTVETLRILSSRQADVFKIRDSLIERLGRVEDGKIVFDNQANEVEFNKEIKDLLEDEFEIPLKEKISLTDKQILTGEDIIALKDILAGNI